MINYSHHLSNPYVNNDAFFINVIEVKGCGKFPRDNQKKIQWLDKCQNYYDTIQKIKNSITILDFTYENSLLNDNAESRKILNQEARRILAEAYGQLQDIGPLLKKIETHLKKQEKKYPNATFNLALKIQYQRCTSDLAKTMKYLQTVQINGKIEQRKQVRGKAILIRNDLTEVQLDKIMAAEDPHFLVQEMATVQLEKILEALDRAEVRNKAVVKIEQEMIALHQLYTSFNLLVQTQQENVQNITKLIEKTENYSERTERNMVAAENSQRRAKKLMWIIIISSTLVISIIVVGLILHFCTG